MISHSLLVTITVSSSLPIDQLSLYITVSSCTNLTLLSFELFGIGRSAGLITCIYAHVQMESRGLDWILSKAIGVQIIRQLTMLESQILMEKCSGVSSEASFWNILIRDDQNHSISLC